MSKYAAFGTKIEVNTSGSIYTEVASVQDVDGPELTLETEDVTSHDSPGGFAELLATIKSAGKVPFKILYDPEHATHDSTTGLLKIYNDKTLANFRVRFPPPVDDHYWQAAGYVTKFQPTRPVKGVLAADIEISISGSVLFT